MTFLVESYTGYWPVSDMAEGYREMAEINLELANAYWPLTQVALEGREGKEAKDYYCIPKWCRMSLAGHFDGMGGCWSISSGLVLNKGEKACRTCEYHG